MEKLTLEDIVLQSFITSAPINSGTVTVPTTPVTEPNNKPYYEPTENFYDCNANVWTFVILCPTTMPPQACDTHVQNNECWVSTQLTYTGPVQCFTDSTMNPNEYHCYSAFCESYICYPQGPSCSNIPRCDDC